ncbi:AAA family ATPase [Streptomyces sp. MPA0124]|uniref:AAA family ATPase n=1 Tax=Streptomyces sp. MPA0124 TaxID=3378069 RepID=UPI003852BCBB
MPLAVLLAGLTGSGKTTVAQALAARGFTRLSVVEEVHRLHGRYGVDYPEHTYFERERPVVEAIRQRFIKELAAGNDVVLDHGLWRRRERDAWRQDANALTVTPEALTDFFDRFDPPADDEDVIVYSGDPDLLVATLRDARQG